jgi:hypothetical protein
MIRAFRSGFVAVLFLLSTACAATRLTTAWKDPESTNVAFKKILVAVMTPSQSLRRSTETKLVAMIGSDRATASYSVFPGDKAPDKETALSKIAQDGYDAVVVMREAGSDVKTDYVPGQVGYAPVAVGWGPYWTTGWVQTYTPGYMTSTLIMRIDVIVFDVKKDKAVWLSQSETKDPSSAQKVIEEVVKGVRSEMRRQGFIS